MRTPLVGEVLICVLVCNLFRTNECTGFQKVGSTYVQYINKNVDFEEAENKCLEKDSTMVEVWSEEEWNEVKIE